MSVQYIDRSGSLKKLDKPIEKKKYQSKFSFEYTDYGLYVAFPVLLGVGLGKWIDSRFGTDPMATIGCIVLGGLLAIYNLYQLLTHKDGDRRSAREHKG